jgi:hypothetical protein
VDVWLNPERSALVIFKLPSVDELYQARGELVYDDDDLGKG